MDKFKNDIGIISGFSGVGKGTICALLKDQTVNGKPIRVIRSVTTRPPRSENDNYYFVGKETFRELIARGMLLEYNDAFAENCYGTPIWEIQRAMEAGEYPVLEIDPVGYQKVLADGRIDIDHIRSIFICADALDVAMRLYGRATEKETTIQRRLETAQKESQSIPLYREIVENMEIAKAAADVLAVFEGKHIDSDFDAGLFQESMTAFLNTFEDHPARDEIPSEDDYYHREQIATRRLFEQELEQIRTMSQKITSLMNMLEGLEQNTTDEG